MVGQITSNEFIAGLAQLGRDMQSPRERRLLLQQMGSVMVDDAIQNIIEGHTPAGTPFAPLAHPRPTGGGGPLDDTGRLPNSLRAVVSGDRVGVVSDHPAAMIHQHSGVVYPLSVQFLTVALTAAARGRRARTIGFPLHARFARGADEGALYDRGGTAHYALKRFVVIPPRPYTGPGPRVDRRLLDLLERWYLPKFPGNK
jgi:phage gpG-like protein